MVYGMLKKTKAQQFKIAQDLFPLHHHTGRTQKYIISISNLLLGPGPGPALSVTAGAQPT